MKLDGLLEVNTETVQLPQDTGFLIAGFCSPNGNTGDYHFFRLIGKDWWECPRKNIAKRPMAKDMVVPTIEDAFSTKGFTFFGYFLVSDGVCIANESGERLRPEF